MTSETLGSNNRAEELVNSRNRKVERTGATTDFPTASFVVLLVARPSQ